MKRLIIHLFIIAVISAVGLWFLLSYLEGYTRQGEGTKMPYYVGLEINKAKFRADTQEFEIVVIDSVWDRKLPKGEIVQQKPDSGAAVKLGRKVYVTINARTKKRIKVYTDNILNGSTTMRGALDNLSSYDVKVDSFLYVDYEYDDIVLDVLTYSGKSLKKEDMIYAGSKLILKVGQRGDESVKISDYLGESIHNVQKELRSKGINSNFVYAQDGTCEGSIDSSNTVIIRQNPDPGSEIRKGQGVDLFYNCR
jgi:beta-lactam-binding protein with PASTA domain